MACFAVIALLVSGAVGLRATPKDGYLSVDCVKDQMFESKAALHYADEISKADQKPMSHAVCFAFCQGKPNMNFFGIAHGRDCYCMPYYHAAASDSSQCHSVCEGATTTMCGGESKSSIFSMHACQDSKENLASAHGKISQVTKDISTASGDVTSVANDMQAAADQLQKDFGAAGDPEASNLMQTAKVFAGELLQAAKDGDAMAADMASLADKVKTVTAGDFTSADTVAEAEALTKEMNAATATGEAKTKALVALHEQAKPSRNDTAGANDRYRSVMYFVDKEFASNPSTCSGTTIGKPLLAGPDGCTAACDAEVHSCVATSYFESGKTSLCFLFSKPETATHYTGCGGGDAAAGFLQGAKRGGVPATECRLKFSSFEGTTVKPDPSGKCAACLKSVTKADRCFA